MKTEEEKKAEVVVRITKGCDITGEKYVKEFTKRNGGRLLSLRFEILKRDNFTCQYCGRNIKEDKVKLHVDHIIPNKLGGLYSENNLVTSCEECNLGKGDVLLGEKTCAEIRKIKLENKTNGGQKNG